MAIIISPGYKGNKDQWFFWDEDEPDWQSGPYTNEQEAVQMARGYVSWEDNPPPIQIRKKSTMSFWKRLKRAWLVLLDRDPLSPSEHEKKPS